MRSAARLPLIVAALLALSAAPAAAQVGGPVIESVEVRIGTGGDPVTLVVEASDPDAPVTGVAVERGGERIGTSGCRRGRDRGGRARFEVPLPGSAADVLGLTVTVLSGGCSQEGRSTTQSLLPALPGSPGLPLVGESPGLLPLPGLPILARASASCRGAGSVPRKGNLRRIRKAVRCLVNATRRGQGLRRLKGKRKLNRAATRHSKDMLRRRYFNHVGPGGPDLGDRLRAVRYRARSAGENLGAGTGGLATPQAIVDAWMKSPGHRANLLGRSWRHIGIGVVPSYPSPPDTPGGAYTAVFARR